MPLMGGIGGGHVPGSVMSNHLSFGGLSRRTQYRIRLPSSVSVADFCGVCFILLPS